MRLMLEALLVVGVLAPLLAVPPLGTGLSAKAPLLRLLPAPLLLAVVVLVSAQAPVPAPFSRKTRRTPTPACPSAPCRPSPALQKTSPCLPLRGPSSWRLLAHRRGPVTQEHSWKFHFGTFSSSQQDSKRKSPGKGQLTYQSKARAVVNLSNLDHEKA